MKQVFTYLIFFASIFSVKGQVYPFIEDFNSMPSFTNPTGWTSTVPGFQVYPNHGNGSQGIAKNLTALGAQSDSIISPLIGPITGSSILSFDYRVMESSLYPCCSYTFAAGDGIDFYAVSGPLSLLLYTIDLSNHIADTGFTTITNNLGSLNGQVGKLKIMVRSGSSGDFFIDFDNISIADASGISLVDKPEVTPLIYPNPAADGLSLQLKNIPEDDYNIRLISSSGNILELGSMKISAGLPLINTRQLHRGFYFLQLTGVNNNFLLRFVVKN